MSFAVETGFLRSIVAPLREAVAAARRLQADSGQMKGYAAECGSDELASAASEFLDRWAYGLGQVAEDADQVATGLERSAVAYQQTEQTVAGAATRLATAGPGAAEADR